MKPQRPGPRLAHQGCGRTPEVPGLPSRPCSPCGGRGGGGRSPLWLPEASSRLAGDLQRPSAGCGAAGPGPRTGCLMCPTAAGLGKLTAGLRAQSLLSTLSCTQGAWETALGWGWGAAFSQATPSTHRGRPEGRARGPAVLWASSGFYTGDLRGFSWAGFLLSSRAFTSILFTCKGGRLCRERQGDKALLLQVTLPVYPRWHAHWRGFGTCGKLESSRPAHHALCDLRKRLRLL